jgi:hypothetical protein
LRIILGVEAYTKPIAVKIVPSKDLLRVGDNLELRCEILGDAQAQVRWSKMQNGEFQDNVGIYGNILKIRDVRNENGGVYRCTASTTGGLFEEDYALTIHGIFDLLRLINEEFLLLISLMQTCIY